MICLLQHFGVGPNLRFRGATTGRKNSDNSPIVATDLQLVADLKPGELERSARSGDHLVFAPIESTALDDLEFVAHLKRGLFDPAKRDVCVGASGAFWHV